MIFTSPVGFQLDINTDEFLPRYGTTSSIGKMAVANRFFFKANM